MRQPQSLPANSEHNSARLFLALVPNEEVRAAVAGHRNQWRWSADAALYAPADWHVTLHFIGTVARHRCDELHALDVPSTPFELQFGQAELWPHGLAVLCPHAVPEAMQQLHARLGQALVRLGLTTDSRRYRPHITMARRAENALLPLQCPRFVWHVASYALMESTGQPAQRYRVLQRYPSMS